MLALRTLPRAQAILPTSSMVSLGTSYVVGLAGPGRVQVDAEVHEDDAHGLPKVRAVAWRARCGQY